ncbi:uncharacterized protein [Glycine max]|uniref:uncharacterized protein n=1 Tax=Glycine max TaxID=3847 RepID=UPI001B3566B6|nr:uncharacterized protein LOC102666093 [Glycine max]
MRPPGSVPDETTTPEEARKQQKQEEALHASNLRVPRHPLWTPNMSADELNASEMQAFLAWRRSLARWFAKRFLHPDIVSIYDYIFLWDEDLGVEHFSPSRYVEIIKREGLEISQPALDPNSTKIHHRITIRARTKKFHRLLSENVIFELLWYHKKYDKTNSFVAIYDKSWHACCVVNDTELQNNLCRFVEGMTPIFSQSAWYCTWHLIQVILLPWFIGILNLSSNYTLKKPFKLFQNFCFFQLYYCVVLTVDNFNILSKVLLLFFSVGSVFQFTKMLAKCK